MKKRGMLHRVIGRVYLYSWVVILVTGYYIGSPIIVAVVLMGAYLSITGVRQAVLKGKPLAGVDKVILGAAALIVVFMLVSAIIMALGHDYVFATIAFFFAILYSVVLTLDIRGFILHKQVRKVNYGKATWYVNHMSRMQFSYITAVGAFTGVQDVFGNTIANFLVPAVVGIVAVRLSTRYFIKQLGIKVVS
jgi:hypothetical protein